MPDLNQAMPFDSGGAEAILALRSILDDLLANGGRISDELIERHIHSGDHTGNLQVSAPNGIYKTLSSLRNVEHLMKGLLPFVSKLHNSISAHLLPGSPCGLYVLPDEALVSIFDYVIFEEPQVYGHISSVSISAVKFSHISRRIRRVVTGRASYWTHITSRLPARVARVSIARSKNLPLSVEVAPGENMLFFLAAVEHSHRRWRTLHVVDRHSALQLYATWPYMLARRLEEVTLGFKDGFIPEEWDTPKWIRVTLLDYIQEPLGPNVQTCNIMLDPSGLPDPVELLLLIESLAQSEALEQLYVKLAPKQEPTFNLFEGVIGRYTFFTLRKLSVHVFLHAVWGNWLCWMDLPSLEDLHLSLTDDSRLDQVQLTAEAITFYADPEEFLLPKLQTLSVDLSLDSKREAESKEELIQLADVLVKCTPILSSVRLGGNMLRPLWHSFVVRGEGEYPFSTMPPLRRIDYHDHEDLDPAYLLSLVRHLRKGSSWTTFEELVISSSQENADLVALMDQKTLTVDVQ